MSATSAATSTPRVVRREARASFAGRGVEQLQDARILSAREVHERGRELDDRLEEVPLRQRRHHPEVLERLVRLEVVAVVELVDGLVELAEARLELLRREQRLRS